jgi:hypothetical protein
MDAFWHSDVAFTTLQSRRRIEKVLAVAALHLSEKGHEGAAQELIMECNPSSSDS